MPARTPTAIATALLALCFASAQQPLPVLVLLKDQPHREIVERLERAAALRYSIAEGEYLSAITPEGRLAARRRLDEVIAETRRLALREIETIIRASQDAVAARLAGLGAAAIQRYSAVNLIGASVPAAALPALSADPLVAEAWVDRGGEGAIATSVPALGAPAFWERGLAGSGEAVAILDTGIRTNHPAFEGITFANQVFLNSGRNGPCFVDDPASPDDRVGHGTHIAGIVASRGSVGFPAHLGVARGLGSIYNVKVLYNCSDPAFPAGRYLDSDVIQGLEWLVQNAPAKVVNFSAGSSTPSEDTALTRILDNLADVWGLSIAVVGGNNGPNASTLWSPGVGFNLLSVANIDTRGTIDRGDDLVLLGSSRGPTLGGRFKPDIAAPGTGIVSASHLWEGGNPDYVSRTGTSMATPHVAGALALVRQSGVTDPLAARALLLATADSAGWQPDRGWGYANLTRAARSPADAALSGTLAPSSIRFFRATTGPLRAVLAWNRHIAGGATTVQNLSLHLFARASNLLVAFSSDTRQNTQEVSSPSAGDFVLKVTGPAAEEAFGLAVSDGRLVPVTGPVLQLVCNGPPSAGPGVTFVVECTASNTGDLDAFSVTPDFGNLAPGGSVRRSITQTAPAAGGPWRIELIAASRSYEQFFSATATLTVNVDPAFTPAALRMVSGDNQSGIVGTTLPAALVVEVRALNGAALAGLPVEFTALNGSVEPELAVTGASGRASARFTLGAEVGAASVTARVASLPEVRFSATARARPIQVSVLAARNGASFLEGLSPGGVFAIRGTNLATAALAATTTPLPVRLGGTSVRIGGRDAPLYYVSLEQINGQVPYEIAPGPASLVVTVDGASSPPLAVPVSAAAPGLFLLSVNRAVVHNQDITVNGRQDPAAPGSVIVAYLTGIGPLDYPVRTGDAAPLAPLSRATLPASATIGSQEAEIIYLGLTPGSIGLAQANLRVPQLPPGDHPLVITVGGVPSNAPVISVGPAPALSGSPDTRTPSRAKTE